jgi:hypothetical protein
LGAVTDAIRRVLPRSYDALVAASGATPQAGQFTQSDAQALADYAKSRLWATVANVTEEVLYSPRLMDFISKLGALDFIPAAIDYWNRQVISESTTGTSESVSYPDAGNSLWRLWNNISKEVANDWPALAAQYGFDVTAGAALPKVSYYDNGRGILVTHDPMSFPKNRQVIGGLVWDKWSWDPLGTWTEDVAS